MAEEEPPGTVLAGENRPRWLTVLYLPEFMTKKYSDSFEMVKDKPS